VSQSLENLYLVSGRLDGHDEDDMRVIATDHGLGHAKLLFKNWLLEIQAENHDRESADYHAENGMVHINCARPLSAMAAEPMTASDLGELRYTDPEDDDKNLPGW